MRAALRHFRTVVALLVLCGAARAEDAYPVKPVRLIVPFSAGGFSDIAARLVGKNLSEKWGVPVVVDNRPGAGGNLGAELAAKSPPDGYTLFLSSIATHAINPALYKKSSFDPTKDFEPVILLATTPNVMVVGKAVPANTVEELIELARKKAGTLNVGSTGNGTSTHLTAALFSSAAGVKISHVPYRGSLQVLADVVSNQVQLSFGNVIVWAPHVKAGGVRALAVTGTKRSSLLPGVRTLQEAGLAKFESGAWFGISVPAGTSQAVINLLNNDINSVLGSEEIRTNLAGAEIVGGTSGYFGQFTLEEVMKWGKVARSLGLQID